MLVQKALKQSLDYFLREDDLERNFLYTRSLPQKEVLCRLKIKSDMRLAGLPFFFEVFQYFLNEKWDYSEYIDEFEGLDILKSEKKEISFNLPFHVALTGERLALNLLHRASSIATTTRNISQKIKNSHLKVLDTRKTTPGLRFLEKYAVTCGGGYNHRFGQADVFMIKDNHKKVLGGLEEAWNFFQNIKGFYQPVVVEIHSLGELDKAFDIGVRHMMLDNFSKEELAQALDMKKEGVTYEASGGIHEGNIEDYDIDGLDVVSMGVLTSYPLKVDLSLKMENKK